MDITQDPELSLDAIPPNIIVVETLIDLLRAREYALKIWCAYWMYVYKSYKNILEQPWKKQYKDKAKKYCELLTSQQSAVRQLHRSLNSWNMRRVRLSSHFELIQRVIELCVGVFMFVVPEAIRVFNQF
jgi:hypothetical protein